VLADAELEITVDLTRLSVEAPAAGLASTFPMEPSTKERFLNGLDDIGLTLREVATIDTFETRRPAYLPSL
jgi:3-isopropylmalate/(R)-2-methylmalate dehydratase small subunit